MRTLGMTGHGLAVMTLVVACSSGGGSNDGAARSGPDESSASGGAGSASNTAGPGQIDSYATAGGGASGGSSSGGAGGAAAFQSSAYASAGGSGSAMTAEGVSTERYDAVGTNPFTMTAHDPLSTFAADVDTASYDLFVRDIDRGTLPNADGVRLEEFVNYFHYGYAPPVDTSEHPFAIDLEAAPSLFDESTTTLRVGIQSRLPTAFEKRPANLVFLVDTSGSMSDDLPLVKYTLLETLSILDPTDTLSIVTYAGSTHVALPPTPVGQYATIQSTIQSFEAGGSTNGGSGIQLAYDQARAAFIEGGINHVLLCTDGDFNVGTTSTTDLVSLIEEERQSGITLTVLGFGSGNLNDAMMESISNKGDGIYGVISSEDQASAYVHDRMLSNLELIAKDMKIQVEFNPNHVLAYRLLGYENRAIADNLFRNDTVDAGEVGAGHQVTALYELVPVGGAVPGADGGGLVADGAPYDGVVEVGADDMVLVKVRYKNVDATTTDPAFEVGMSLAAAGAMDSIDLASEDSRWAFGVAAVAEVLKQSPFARTDQLPTVRGILEGTTNQDADRLGFVARTKVVEGLLGL